MSNSRKATEADKRPFVTKEMIGEIVKTYPTPFHIR